MGRDYRAGARSRPPAGPGAPVCAGGVGGDLPASPLRAPLALVPFGQNSRRGPAAGDVVPSAPVRAARRRLLPTGSGCSTRVPRRARGLGLEPNTHPHERSLPARRRHPVRKQGPGRVSLPTAADGPRPGNRRGSDAPVFARDPQTEPAAGGHQGHANNRKGSSHPWAGGGEDPIS